MGLLTGCVADADVSRHALGDRSRACAATAATWSCRGARFAAGRFIFTAGKKANRPDNWPTRIWRRSGDLSLDAVIVNVAGCGAMLKDYGHHWHDSRQADRAAFAAKIRDVHEFLDQLGLAPRRRAGSRTGRRTTMPCHLASRSKNPRSAAAAVEPSARPGTSGTDRRGTLLASAAGTYNLTQPEMSARLSRRKMSHILETGARAVLTPNAGCLLQIHREAAAATIAASWIAHPMDLLGPQLPWRAAARLLRAA